MGDRIWQFSLLFFGLLAMQVLLFDNIELFGFFLEPRLFQLEEQRWFLEWRLEL